MRDERVKHPRAGEAKSRQMPKSEGGVVSRARFVWDSRARPREVLVKRSIRRVVQKRLCEDIVAYNLSSLIVRSGGMNINRHTIFENTIAHFFPVQI